MKFVIFIDALDTNDLTPWMKEHFVCQYNPGVPKVTPNVFSQLLTGNRPEDMRFVRSTPYKKPRETDLKDKTILHYAAEDKGLKVLSYGVPMCANVTLPEGSVSTYDHFLGAQNIPAVLNFAKDQMDMINDDPELCFHAMVDQTSVMFGTLRTIARNDQFDVMFIYYQAIDAYTHCWNPENKARLLAILTEELKDLNRYGDILFVSDHGNTARIETFYINKFLEAWSWLHYEVDYRLLDFHKNPEAKYPDTVGLEHPHTWIDWKKTKFYCVDAFDSMIDATELATEEDKEAVRDQLARTGLFNSVKMKEQIFDPTGKEFDFCPTIIPDAKEGVVVSCNIHKDAKAGNKKCMEEMRDGWHSDRAVVGCTYGIDAPKIEGPRDVYKALRNFIDTVEPKKRDGEEEKVTERLENLGYG